MALENRPGMQLALGDKAFYLWRACSPAEHRLGLKQAAAAGFWGDVPQPIPGMMFVYPGDRIALFSMQDVAFDLDLALFDAHGYLLHIDTLLAGSKASFSWPEPVRYAIETSAGSLQHMGLEIGEQVLDESVLQSLRQLCASP